MMSTETIDIIIFILMALGMITWIGALHYFTYKHLNTILNAMYNIRVEPCTARDFFSRGRTYMLCDIAILIIYPKFGREIPKEVQAIPKKLRNQILILFYSGFALGLVLLLLNRMTDIHER